MNKFYYYFVEVVLCIPLSSCTDINNSDSYLTYESELPILYINTKQRVDVTSKDEWLAECVMVIGKTEKENEQTYQNVSIKGRGNSTWNYPKKSYAIKLATKSEVLGMPKHKRWCLLANYMDRTLMRNAVAFEIARKTESLGWTPQGKFVEVVLNGDFLGNYYLCEQIKVDDVRVDVTEMSPSDVENNTITGGYLLELDVNFDEVNKFRSFYGFDSQGDAGLPVNIKSPDENVLVMSQLEYIKDYVCLTESLLYAKDFPIDNIYREYIDVNSFIDYWFVYELTQNAEPNHPKSVYMHKDRGGKLKAGPVWDFDWGTFDPNTTTVFEIKDAVWYNRLFLDPEFVNLVKTKWMKSRSKFYSVVDYIDKTAISIKSSAEANGEQWPISSNVNGDEQMTFDAAVARLKSAYVARLEWMDKAIEELH